MANEKFYDAYGNEIEIKENDFKFTQKDKNIHDIKFESKPTTFFKDALKRFTKNKSSVAGAIILGILLVLSFLLPVVLTTDIEKNHPSEALLLPKLFKTGTGFWDGTKKYEHQVYDPINKKPASEKFLASAVVSLKTTNDGDYFLDTANAYGYGGYVRFETGFILDKNQADKLEENTKYFYSPMINYYANSEYTMKFNLLNQNYIMEGYELATYRVILTYKDENQVVQKIVLQDWSKNYGEISINITDVLTEKEINVNYNNAQFGFEILPSTEARTYILIENCVFETNNKFLEKQVNALTFTDANAVVLLPVGSKTADNIPNYWQCNGIKGVYRVHIIYCDFVYDIYYEKYGIVENTTINSSDLDKYIALGLCEYDYSIGPSSFKILSDSCPVRSITDQTTKTAPGLPTAFYKLTGDLSLYRYMGYDKMPRYLLGTDNNGKDLIKVSFSGLRTSLLLGFATFAFCFTFGLIWGSISGYFGGNVDIVMERFTEILSGVPWIVIMTLCIIHFGSNFGTIFLALCLTGWIGTSARTRTQFYRFKGREYILASRTLGASDGRLIFRHILPNAIGTIITGSILMIPSSIFSEATIAYLGLGLQNMNSLGVTLSNNQSYLETLPHLVLLPAIIISLIMISFNLFGNGLRDAFNPSLKGSE